MWLVNTAPTFGVDFGSASVGTVTVTITRSDGTAVVTDAATVNNADGTYSYQLAATNNTRLDRLRLDWTVTSTSEGITFYEEITRNLLFTIEEARGARFTGQQAPLASDTTYPDSVVARMRELIATQFEEKTSHSWVRRYCRMEITGTSSRQLSLYRGEPRDVDGNESGGAGRLYNVAKLISVTVDGVAVADLTTIQLAGRSLIRDAIWPWSSTPFNIVVEYEYGDDPVDLEARENGLQTIVNSLVKGDISQYAVSFSGEEGTTTYPPGGFVWDSKTREWLDRHPRRRIPVAI